jgi:ribonucleoside-diphosphate reductase beta chain
VHTPGLLRPSANFRPYMYPWAVEYCRQQHRIHWTPDWGGRLTDGERGLLTQIFRFFTQSDVQVNDNYLERYMRVFRPTEVKMMLSAFASMETIHILAYSLLLDTVGMPDEEFSAFRKYEAMSAKADYMETFGVDSVDDILRTTAMFGGATEGLSLFASFAMLMHFPRRRLMKGMGQIVTWSVRDESLHCDGIIRLHHTLAAETGGRSRSVDSDIMDVFATQVRLEDAFVELAFETSGGEVEGLSAADMKLYIRRIADWRLHQLRLPPMFGVVDDPVSVWLSPLLSGVEHANFFETRATEYSKGATRGSWPLVWTSFEQMMGRRQSRAQFVGWMACRYMAAAGMGRGEAVRMAEDHLRLYLSMTGVEFGDDSCDWLESDAHFLVDEDLSDRDSVAAA